MTQRWTYWNAFFSKLKEVESIQDSKEKEKVATAYITDLVNEFSRNSDFLVTRLVELESDVTLIDVPKTLMDALKEATFCYLNGQYLSTIAATGIVAELFCVHIYTMYLEGLGLDRSRIKRRLASFSRISQDEKIHTLFSVVNVNDHICSILQEIKKTRNKSVHPHIEREYKSDALDSLQNLIDVLNEYSHEISKLQAANNSDKK